MGSKLVRIGDCQKILITNDINTTEVIEFSDDADMILHIPNGWTTTTLTFYSYNPLTNLFYVIRDPADNIAQLSNVAANTARQAPQACFPCNKVKIVSGSAANNAIEVEVHTKG
jgi:hypothetical protein